MNFRRIVAAVVTGVMFLIASLIMPRETNAEQSGTLALRDHPLSGKIYDTAAQSFITSDQMVRVLATSPHVLLGEIHDNVDHHRLQAEMIARLVAAGQRPTIVMEMLGALSTSTLEALEAERRDGQTVTAADYARRLKWAKSGWPPFEIYAPIFEVAIANNLPLVSARPAADSGGSVQTILDAAPLPSDENEELLAELTSSHCGLITGEKAKKMLPKMQRAQRKLDIALAVTMRQASGASVLIAGSGHTRMDRGVPHYLRHFERQSVTVNFREVVAGKTDPASLIDDGEADYIWFTPRVARGDVCAQMREMFAKRKKP
ncbi:MAG: ChaN family lipoprotein [Pseudomonadota bacterium]